TCEAQNSDWQVRLRSPGLVSCRYSGAGSGFVGQCRLCARSSAGRCGAPEIYWLYGSGCRPGNDFLYQSPVLREGVRFSRRRQRIRQNGRRIQREHVHLKLGEQIVELTQYISPPTGRPIPVPSYSNDEWFEHMAIVVRDMDAAYKILQENNVQQISANPITIPESNPGAAGIKAVKFRDPEGHD